MLPSFLGSTFEASELDASKSSIAAVADDGTVLWVNESWRRREQAYGIGSTIGGSYWTAISGELREHYRRLFGEARESESVREQLYECPTFDKWQTFRVRILAVATDGFLVEHSLVTAQPAPHGRNPGPRYRSDEGIVTQCSNCRKFYDLETQAWHWVPAWMERPPPQTSHGLCALCASYFYGGMEIPRPR